MALHRDLTKSWGPRPDWMNQAHCIGEPPQVFFPSDERGAELAKAICAECAVRQECLDYILAHHRGPTDAGVWGGTTEQERRRMRRSEARARAKARANMQL